ncbi:cytochrome P450 [Mollisia scopiformis]|uniref:Cytochrome P450 n=1 Tax=Mollisia scopiformis TaxID=149040 RepID=A0A194XVW5_MOLSC|nr:cytochrome P450 [Mollisia scopiformis]KUJ24373.1 cytochrome P450 [Mollisia scopiformis]
MGGYAETLLPGSAPPAVPTTAFLGFLALLWIILTREATPLRKIPGPFLASITRLWIVQKQRSFQRPLVDIDLHKKYGPIVRIAPNEVLISSPQAFRTVYGAGSNFRKGDWYIGTSACGWSGDDNLDFLNEQNVEKYRTQRRAVGPAYSEASMKDLEPQIDEVLEKDISIMRQRADCYSMTSFSKSKDLVEKNEVDGSIHAIHAAWKYMHVIGYFPLLHRALTAVLHIASSGSTSIIHMINTFFPFIERETRGAKTTSDNPFAFPILNVEARFEARKSSSLDPKSQHVPNDIAGKLFQLQADKGVLKDHWVMNMVMTNFGAGVETTAIVVSTLINNIVSHPGCQEKVHAELDKARKEGRIGKIPQLREMKEQLPYLNACLMESMRMHSVVGMPLVRVVPEGGVELEGKWLPAGTTVGINPWVLCRDKFLYGEDADEWRPERWLEYSPDKLKYLGMLPYAMAACFSSLTSTETYSVSFGTGARSCPGKYLAQAVYTKMIPMLFQDFEWSYTNPEAKKVLQCTFSVRYMKLMMQWKLREQTA